MTLGIRSSMEFADKAGGAYWEWAIALARHNGKLRVAAIPAAARDGRNGLSLGGDIVTREEKRKIKIERVEGKMC